MATALTHKYIPRIAQIEENLFIEEYYSSTDVKIFIDGEEQTEISYINYSLQEQLKPLYGYASRTFDDVAIGNRIVTGTLKIPIKNPESQSSIEDIEKTINSLTVDDYNKEQDNNMDNTDWINTPAAPTSPKDTEGNIVNEDKLNQTIIAKLIHLGYSLDFNATTEVYVREIKKFQADNNLDPTGILTSQTIAEIEKELAKFKKEIVLFLPRGTRIYIGPSKAFDGFVLKEDEDVLILGDRTANGWTHIMTKDSVEGYINTNEV